ncbi:MAG: aspartate--tRNA ligase [Candidatus Spechtbacteria bacterium]|nr:aspartate--tRNA ligase [Candidatus Spechtbacteria bacterium]
MARCVIKDIVNKENSQVSVAGWVHAKRVHGKITFIDLRDASGILQVVFTQQNAELFKIVDAVRPEWVLKISGTIQKRPEKMKNPEIITGDFEMIASTLEVISKAETPPFPIEGSGYDVSEDIRWKYRYLDMRRPRVLEILKQRAKVKRFIRDYLSDRGFLEVDTPILTKSTPEGARDFLVPSRLHPGKFYALPQSPQQYKQLLMVGGIEKYFQFPRCFRDEDLRGDRTLEFDQLDIEMSFVDEADVLKLTEELVIEVSEKVIGKKVQEKPFPRMTYQEAMKQYQSDKPDIRKDKNDKNTFAYLWVTDFPMFEKKDDGSVGAAHHPFTAIHDSDLPKLTDSAKLFDIRARQYDLVLNGHEVFGGSIRTTNPEILTKVFNALGYSSEEIQVRFHHLLEAFSYGVPPHGGIAAGFDRWLMAMLAEPSIREVIPFPTSGSGFTSVMEAPSNVDKKQLSELHIKAV